MKKLFLLPVLSAALGLMSAGLATAQTFTTLHSFEGINYNDSYGVNPQGGLVLSGNNLYGTTFYGGNAGGYGNGTVFTYNVNGTGFEVLYNFAGGSFGANPRGGMALSGNSLFGTTEFGGKTGGNLGVSGNGTVFKVNTDGTGFTNLYTFGAEVADYALGVYTNGDGMFPQAGMIVSGNTLYGTAENGGTNGSGTVFAVNTNGTGFTVLHTFKLLVEIAHSGVYTNFGGAQPLAGLVLSGNTLYGTTSIGGTNGSGTVFAVNTDGTGFTNLYNFPAARQDANLGYASTNSSGASPLAALMLSGSTLYGAAEYGGTNGSGTLFSINTNGTGFAVLHSFQPTAYNPSSLTTNSEGANPVAGLFLSGNTLYGTAGYGGTNGYGTAFAVNTDGTGFTNLYTFAGLNDGIIAQQGSFAFLSSGAFVLSGGTLYAAAPGGGTNGNGTVFGVNTNGSGLANVYAFSGYFTNIEGIAPLAGLVQSGNTLYGTTSSGGTNNNGTVFAINNDGTGYVNIYSFSAFGNYNTNGDGANPAAGLILSGNTLYGTANNGGTNGFGSVFKVNTDGTDFTNLHNFTGTGSDGGNPQAGLFLSGNTLYGTASFGGSSFGGTVFAIHTDGTGFTNLYSFTGANDGGMPMAGLVLSGNCLYGTVSQGGTNFFGAVFAVNTNGTANGKGYTNLYSFSGSFANDGDSPMAGLILSGKTLYGTTSGEFSGSYGTVFAIHTDGTGYTNLYSFTGGSGGANPVAGLFLSGNTLYGTTSGYSSGNGTVFVVNTNGTAGGTGFTNLYSFAGGLNGANPQAGVIISGNTLYGTAQKGGSSSDGTVFSLSVGPVIILTPPAITGIALSGTNLVINGSNGQSGGTYVTLTTTNLTLGQWAPVATNVLNVSGIFSFTATNVVNSTDRQRFFRIVQTQ